MKRLLPVLLLMLATAISAFSEMVTLGYNTYLFTPTTDNVNVRTGPGTDYPILTDRWGNKLTVDTPGRYVGCPFIGDRDWICIFGLPNTDGKDAYVSAKYLVPVDTKGFGQLKPNSTRIYFFGDFEAPEEDEEGCWLPTLKVGYLYDNGLYVETGTGFNRILMFGRLEDNVIKWFGRANAYQFEEYPEDPSGYSIALLKDDEWPRINIRGGKKLSLAALKPGVFDEDLTQILDLSQIRVDQMEKIIADAIQKGLIEEFDTSDATGCLLVEDFEREDIWEVRDVITRTWNN